MCRLMWTVFAWIGMAGVAVPLVHGEQRSQSARRRDVTKSLVVEAPAVALVSRVGAPAPRTAGTAPTSPAVPLAGNPAVVPGDVRWHASFEKAR